MMEYITLSTFSNWWHLIIDHAPSKVWYMLALFGSIFIVSHIIHIIRNWQQVKITTLFWFAVNIRWIIAALIMLAATGFTIFFYLLHKP